jgi:hypothetical protein
MGPSSRPFNTSKRLQNASLSSHGALRLSLGSASDRAGDARLVKNTLESKQSKAKQTNKQTRPGTLESLAGPFVPE